MTSTELYIDTNEAARELVQLISGESTLALDTEFVRERTYYPELCLIQIASDTLTACVDCLSNVDVEALLESLFAPGRAWILHSARQDLEVIDRFVAQAPDELWDTQIAAGLAGFSPQIGLQELLAEVLDVQLEKGYARTDWSRRPLADGALRYAFDDVRHLKSLWEALTERLRALGRFDWLMEDCRLLRALPPSLEASTLWSRLKGLGRLEPEAQCAAHGLVVWREHTAQALNRPRRWILSDDLLLTIARTLPTNRTALRAIAELPNRLAERSGADILAAIDDRSDPDVRAMVEARMAREHPDKLKFKRLQERVKARASELGINPELFATRREILEILRGEHSERTRRGWRAAELQQLVEAE